jgi:F0F1-type ATP synthase assembly protein I
MTASPPGRRRFDPFRQISLALELPLIFVVEVLLGGLIGFGLDHALHTKPWLTLLFGFIGFGAGMWDLIRRLGSGNGQGGA